MKLKLNGNMSEIRDSITVSGLLESLNISAGSVAVEVNLNIIKKCDFEKCMLKDGDAVEIVNFVGGG